MTGAWRWGVGTMEQQTPKGCSGPSRQVLLVVDLSSLGLTPDAADVPNECLHACTNQKLCISHERNETNQNRRGSPWVKAKHYGKSDAAGRRKED